jgi:hypothetical protein
MATLLAPLTTLGGGWLGGGFTSFTGSADFDVPGLTLSAALAPAYTGGAGAYGATIANLGPAGFTLGGQSFTFAGADTLALRLGGPLGDIGGGGALGLTQAHAGVFTMHIADVSEAYVNGDAAQAKGGLAVTVELRMAGGEVAGISGSVFSDAVTVTGGGAGASSSVALGLGHDSFTGGGNSMDIVIGGHGDDSLAGGGGNDHLFGDADEAGYAGDVAWIGNRAELGTLDPGQYVDAVAQLAYLGSESGFNNLVGYYYRDDATGDLVGRAMFEDDRAANKGITIRLTAAEAETLQFFVVANGANLNASVLNGLSANSVGWFGDGLVGAANAGVDIRIEAIALDGGAGRIGGSIGQVVIDGGAADGTVLRGALSNGLGGSGLLLQQGGQAVQFSAFFTDGALNPFGRDYALDFGLNEAGTDDATAELTGIAALDSNGSASGDPNTTDFTFAPVYTAAEINNGTIAQASIAGHALLQQNNLWGQVGMEDMFQGTGAMSGGAYTNNRTDRDFDDVVLQSRVWFELGGAEGADTLEGGADGGSFVLPEWSLAVSYEARSSAAFFNSGIGYYFSTAPGGEYAAGDLLQGSLLDGGVLGGASSEFASNPAQTVGGDNTATITGLDAQELQGLRWFLMRDLTSSTPAGTPVLIEAELFDQDPTDGVSAADLLASRVYIDRGVIGVRDAADVLLAQGNWAGQTSPKDQGVGIFSEADLNYNDLNLVGQAVLSNVGTPSAPVWRWLVPDGDGGVAGTQAMPIPDLLAMLDAATRIGIGFEDASSRLELDTGGDNDVNDLILSVTRTQTRDFAITASGDIITGGGGADAVVWNRGDGVDIVTDFDVTQDVLQWGPAGTPFAMLVDADGDSAADDLLVAETAASTEGVILLNLNSTDLTGWLV